MCLKYNKTGTIIITLPWKMQLKQLCQYVRSSLISTGLPVIMLLQVTGGQMDELILIVNTGATSTKVGAYRGTESLFIEKISHSDDELSKFKEINDQKKYREETVLELLKEKGIDLSNLSAVSARGGLLRSISSGTYLVNDRMITDLLEAKRGTHASHLSARIGQSIAEKAGVPCYVVDPVSVDEYGPLARYSGHSEIERISLSHALNMKAVTKRHAKEQGKKYTELSLIVIHCGSGISVSIHQGGRMIDGINSSEEGPFAPDRCGGLPIRQVVQYVFEKGMNYREFSKMVLGNGGLSSYLGSRDFAKVMENYRAGDKKTIEVVKAMAYQVAKEAGGLATVVKGKLDGILVTGGMAYVEEFVALLKDRLSFLAPIFVYPGEDEIQALAEGALRVLRGEEEVLEY